MFDFAAALAALKGFTNALTLERLECRSVSGGYWIAGIHLGGLPCFFIGGPGIDDDRIFLTPEAALGALGRHIGNQRASALPVVVYPTLRLDIPSQYDLGGDWYFARIAGEMESPFFVIGPNGPESELYVQDSEAQARAYKAVSGVAY